MILIESLPLFVALGDLMSPHASKGIYPERSRRTKTALLTFSDTKQTRVVSSYKIALLVNYQD